MTTEDFRAQEQEWAEAGFRDRSAQNGTAPGGEEHPMPSAEEQKWFWESLPELGVIRDFAWARVVNPWALLGAVLARVTAAMPPELVLPAIVGRRAGTGVYAVIVDGTGAGKSNAYGVAEDVLPLEPWQLRQASLTGTGEGISDQYVEWRKDSESGEAVAGVEPFSGGRLVWVSNSVLLSTDEIESVKAMLERSGTTLADFLRKGWKSERNGFTYRTRDKRTHLPPLSYRVCAVACGTPDMCRTLLDRAEDGTPARWTFLPGADPEMPDLEAMPAEPAPLAWSPPRIPPSGLYEAQVPAEVHTEIRTHQIRRHQGKEKVSLLDAHAGLVREKWALAFTLLREGLSDQEGGLDPETEFDPGAPVPEPAGIGRITMADWQRAGIYMRVSNHERAKLVATAAKTARERSQALGRADAEREAGRAGATVQQTAEAILGKLGKLAPGEWATGGKLTQNMSKAQREVSGLALDMLMDGGRVECQETRREAGRRGGGKGTQYRLAANP